MKITKYIQLGAFSLIALTSCQEEDVKDPIVNIQFPDAVEHTMASDDQTADTIAIKFNLPVKWDLTSSASEWVSFLDGDKTHPSLAGQTGEHTVKVVIAPNEGFNSDSATVTLSAGAQKEVVAKIFRGEVTPELAISVVNTDTGESTPVEDGIAALEWSESNFRYSAQIKVTANYDWELENVPAWISKETLIQEGSANSEVTLNFNSDYKGYTAEEMSSELVFRHQRNEEVKKTFELRTESLVGKVRISDSNTEYFNGLTVDHDGNQTKEDIVTEFFDLNILSGEPVQFLAYEGTVWENQFYFGVNSPMGGFHYPEAFWVTIEDDANNATENYSPAASLYKKLLSFSTNEGEERVAGLLAIPQSIYDVHGANIENYIDAEGLVKPEFKEAGLYITHLTQTAAEGQGGLSLAYESEGASIRPMTEEDGELFFFLQYELGVNPNGINQLNYKTPAASEMGLVLTPGATSAFVPNPEQTWLGVEFIPDFEGQGPACFIVVIRENLPTDAEYPIQGQVVLKDATGINKYGINVVLESGL